MELETDGSKQTGKHSEAFASRTVPKPSDTAANDPKCEQILNAISSPSNEPEPSPPHILESQIGNELLSLPTIDSALSQSRADEFIQMPDTRAIYESVLRMTRSVERLTDR